MLKQRGIHLIVFCVTLLFLAGLTHDTVFWAGNDVSRFAQIEALVDYGHTHIDASRYCWTVDRVTIDGKNYSNKPPLFSLIGAGVYWGLKHVFGFSFADDQAATVYLLILILVGVPTAWLVARFYALLDVYPEIGISHKILTTVALAAGTILTSFAVTMSNHPVAAALLVAACLAAWRGSGLIAGAWLGLLGAIDILPGVVFAPVLALIVYQIAGRKSMGRYILAVLAGAALFVAVNWWVHGSPLPPKMAPGAADHSGSFPPSDDDIQINVPVQLFPDDWRFPLSCLFGWHGFFSVSPVLLFGVWGMVRTIRDGEPLGRYCTLLLAGGCGVLTLGHVLFVHSFGGWSYGYRYLIPIIPILLFFVPKVLIKGRVWLFGIVLIPSILSSMLGAYDPWPPVAEPEYEDTAHQHPYASLVSNPIGGNAGAWLYAHFPDLAVTEWMGSAFIHPNQRLRMRYLLLFYRSKGYSFDELP